MIHVILWALVHNVMTTEVKIDKKGRTFLSIKLDWPGKGRYWAKSVVAYPTKTGYRLIFNYGGHRNGKVWSSSGRINLKANRHTWTVLGKGGKYVETLWLNGQNVEGLDILAQLGGNMPTPYGKADCPCEECKSRREYVWATTVFATHGFSCGCEECESLPF